METLCGIPQQEETIFLVAPDSEARARFEKMLGDNGWRVAVVEGDFSVDDGEVPALILVSAEGDGFDVVDLVRRVRSKPVTENTPVIVLSGRPDKKLALSALKDGADDVATGPFTKKRFLERIRAHLTLANLRREEGEHVPRVFEQLRLSERRYRLLMSATTAIVWVAGEEGRIVEELTSWEAFTGQSWEEYREFGWLTAVHEEDRESLQTVWPKALNDGQNPVAAQFRLRRRDGEYRDMDLTAVPVRSQQGRFLEWVGGMADITERRRAEETLREREQRLRLILESSKDFGIFTMDMEGVVTTWNAGAERLLGYSEEEICGQDFHRIFTARDIEEGVPDQEMRNALAAGRGADQRWHVRKDGSRFWADGLVMPLRDRNGEVHGFLKIIRDFSEQKEAQDSLRALTNELEQRVMARTEELEESRTRLRSLVFELNKVEQMERQRIAAELHDGLAQLLTAAQMSLEGVARKVGDPAVAPSLEKVQDVIAEATRATRGLMTELSGPRVSEHDDLVVALQWVVDRMGEEGFTVKLRSDESEIRLERDRLMLLFQSVRELLLNVQKHAGVSEALVRIQCDSDTIEVEVSDDGEGFDPKEKLGSPGRDGGFGLFNIQERLRWLGGRFYIESAAGRGTCSKLTLPIRDEGDKSGGARRAKGSAHPEGGKPEGDRATVLLVDDHRMVREGLRRVMEEKPGIRVVGEAADGNDALEKARELRPDVVVMDINMPGMNGLDVTRRLVEEMPELKVIGLSLHGHNDLAEDLRKAGGAGYVSKEEAFDTLCDVIRTEYRRKAGQALVEEADSGG